MSYPCTARNFKKSMFVFSSLKGEFWHFQHTMHSVCNSIGFCFLATSTAFHNHCNIKQLIWCEDGATIDDVSADGREESHGVKASCII